MIHLNSLYNIILKDSFGRSMIVDISITDNGKLMGTVNGVIHTRLEDVLNLLKIEKASSNAFETIGQHSNKLMPLAILQNINIYEEHRGKGWGNKGMEMFITEVDDMAARGILLIADLGEENSTNLVEWYKGFGFEIIGWSQKNPIMLWVF